MEFDSPWAGRSRLIVTDSDDVLAMPVDAAFAEGHGVAMSR
jgi:hypothetical protein